MKTFQIVIEGTVPGDSATEIAQASESLRAFVGKFAANLSAGGNVRRAGLSLENPPGHHAADSQYFDLLAPAEGATAEGDSAAAAPEAAGAGAPALPEGGPVEVTEAPAGDAVPTGAVEEAKPVEVTGSVLVGPEVTA